MATPRILVVDDDEQMRFVLGESLTRRQYEVMLVVSAEEALAALAHGAFDLILLDVRLPKMSGIDALDEILRVDHRAPVILITAHDNVQVRMRAAQAGVSAYLRKPVDEQDLLQAIRRALGLGASTP